MPTDPEWAKTLTPGCQKRRMDNFNAMFSGLPQDEDLVSDGWTDIFRNLGLAAAAHAARDGVAPEELGRMIEISDFKKMNQVRARVDATVKDPKTAEALKPWYRQFCKRPTFNDDYLPTFNRPNVTLVTAKAICGRRCQQEAPIPAPFVGATRPPPVSALEMSFVRANATRSLSGGRFKKKPGPAWL
jgi:hypothetical protein